MLLFWKENISYWEVAIPYVLLGIGVGLSGTPSSNSLTGSVPVTRVGMASGTADLQRDLGGALMTSIFGALLTAGYASAMGAALAGTPVTGNTQAQLQLSFASAENVAAHHPAQASQITAAAQSSFLKGDQWAYLAAMVAVLIGMALVYRFFPRKKEEEALRAGYEAHDQGAAADAEPPPIQVPAPGGPAVVPGHVAPPDDLA
jgi:DHA2 family multidrug resistance protein-like MFS transporter